MILPNSSSLKTSSHDMSRDYEWHPPIWTTDKSVSDDPCCFHTNLPDPPATLMIMERLCVLDFVIRPKDRPCPFMRIVQTDTNRQLTPINTCSGKNHQRDWNFTPSIDLAWAQPYASEHGQINHFPDSLGISRKTAPQKFQPRYSPYHLYLHR